MKRAALYARVSTSDQNCDTQLLDLRQLAEQRGFAITETYIDHGISGARAKRPGLDQLMADARRGKVDVLLIWSFDRLARSVRHLIEVLDELSKLGIEFISFREAIDTSAALGRALIVIIGAIGELERNLDHRTRACRHAPGQARRPAHRSQTTRTRPRVDRS